MQPQSDGFLQIRRNDALVRVAALLGPRMVVGRSPDVDVVLESDTVSRQHLELIRDDGGRWWARDLGSRNGTAINGKQIANHRLSYGDVIQVEDYILVYVATPGATASAVRKPVTAEGPASSTRLTMIDSPVGAVRSLRELGAPKIDASQLSRLIALSGELLATESDSARLGELCSLMIGRDLRGTAAMALRVRRSGDEDAELILPPFLANPAAEPPHISRTMLRSVLSTGTPVVASTASAGTKDLLKLSVVVQSMSAVAVPIGGDTESLEVLYVTFPSNYGTAEWLALISLACELYRQADNAWDARKAAQEQAILEEELERARDIQTRLVPDDFHLGQLDIGFGFEACKWVGGDYVDALPLHDGRVLITIMDVCGKGLEAALIAAGLHTTVHVLVDQGIALAPLVRALNRYLCDTLPAASFVTMCSLVIDPQTGAMEQVNCGHPPPLIAGAGGQVREVTTHDHAPLGFLDVDAEVVVTRDVLPRDHLLVLYTDGLSELLDEADRMLGVEGLSVFLGQIARQVRDASATRLAGDLRGALADYRGRAVSSDDTSFVLVLRTVPHMLRTGPQRAAMQIPNLRGE